MFSIYSVLSLFKIIMFLIVELLLNFSSSEKLTNKKFLNSSKIWKYLRTTNCDYPIIMDFRFGKVEALAKRGDSNGYHFMLFQKSSFSIGLFGKGLNSFLKN